MNMELNSVVLGILAAYGAYLLATISPGPANLAIMATATGLLTLIECGEVFDDLHEGVSGLVIYLMIAHAAYLYLLKETLARAFHAVPGRSIEEACRLGIARNGQ